LSQVVVDHLLYSVFVDELVYFFDSLVGIEVLDLDDYGIKLFAVRLTFSLKLR